MRATARFTMLMFVAAILAGCAAAGLFVVISAANEMRVRDGNAALYCVLFVACFCFLSCVLVRQHSRIEN